MNLKNLWEIDPDPGPDSSSTHHHTTNLLCMLALSLRAQTIVEAGAYRGRTAIAIAKALRDEEDLPFQVWTAEVEFGLAEEARAHVEANGVRQLVSVYHGDYLDMLEVVPGEIDLAFIDGGMRYPMVMATRDRLSEHGLIVVDDMDDPGHWTDKGSYHATREMASIWIPHNRGLAIITK